MELRHLRYFVVVGEEQRYGRAAEQLHIAQPARSHQIQDLEEEIGVKLFDPLPPGVKITEAGASFLDNARRILQQVNEATMRAGRRSPRAVGDIARRIHRKLVVARRRSEAFRQFRARQPPNWLGSWNRFAAIPLRLLLITIHPKQ